MPIGAYFRLVNVDVPRLVGFMEQNSEDFRELIIPDPKPAEPSGYAMSVHAIGFNQAIERAESDGFEWIIPKRGINLKTGLLPGEININVVSFVGNGLDEGDLSEATVEVHRQAYCCWEFMKKYVPGCEDSIFLELAPKLGVRETRRIVGDYIITESDIREGARFEDTIGFSECAIDISGVIDAVPGHEIPFRSLVPRGLDGILVAGRCISVDRMAYGSIREVPACAITGEAAGAAAALAAHSATSVRSIEVPELQRQLRTHGVALRSGTG
jgi:hypothetical protein